MQVFLSQREINLNENVSVSAYIVCRISSILNQIIDQIIVCYDQIIVCFDHSRQRTNLRSKLQRRNSRSKKRLQKLRLLPLPLLTEIHKLVQLRLFDQLQYVEIKINGNGEYSTQRYGSRQQFLIPKIHHEYELGIFVGTAIIYMISRIINKDFSKITKRI